MKLFVLLFILMTVKAHATTCSIRITGLANSESFFLARKLFLKRGHTVSDSADHEAIVRYCTNCGYYGEGSMLELSLLNQHFQVVNYANNNIDEMLPRVIGRLEYCGPE